MPTNPYGPSDPAKRHSAAMTDGPDRAPARAMLKGDRLHRRGPRHARSSASRRPGSRRCRATSTSASWRSTSRRGIRAAGGTPIEFNTIAVSDGVSMGTEGMRASLVSREVIADSIELVARGHLFDGLVVPRRLRQDDPGGGDGAGAPRHPRARRSTAARSRPAASSGRDVTIQDVFEAVGAHAAGKMSGRGAPRARERRLPRAPARAAASSPPTRCRWRSTSSASARPGLNGVPALAPRQGGRGRRGRASWSWSSCATTCARRRSSRARRSRTRSPAVAATGGSTNGVLHLLAIARELGIPLDDRRLRRDRRRARRSSPSLKPGGRFVATDLHAAGGVALVARELRQARACVHADARNVDGRTLGEIADAAAGDAGPGGRRCPIETPAQADRRPRDPARQPRARGLRREARRPRAAACTAGPARVFDSEEECLRGGQGARDPAGRRGRHPLRGPGRRPGHARDAARHRGARRRGARRRGRAGHRRALLGRDARPHGRPRRARGGARRPDRRRARRRHGRDRRRRAASCASSSPTTRSPRAWPTGRRRRRATRAGVLAKYAALVSSASEGAVTRPSG